MPPRAGRRRHLGLLVLESPGGTVRFTHTLVRAALHDGLPLQQREFTLS
ncbi:hypothetical protein [Nocardia sp. NPDC051981]